MLKRKGKQNKARHRAKLSVVKYRKSNISTSKLSARHPVYESGHEYAQIAEYARIQRERARARARKRERGGREGGRKGEWERERRIVPFVKAVIEPMKGRGPQRATTPFSHLRAATAAARGRDNDKNVKWSPSAEFNERAAALPSSRASRFKVRSRRTFVDF